LLRSDAACPWTWRFIPSNLQPAADADDEVGEQEPHRLYDPIQLYETMDGEELEELFLSLA
jgi:hypothetical protein